MPWFLVWFAGAAALSTAGAIGLSTRLSHLRAAGARPLLLGTLVWVAVAGTSLAVQAVTG